MLKVGLTSFFFFLLYIVLAELALHTVSLLGQLVFCTYALFGILNIHYECGRVVKALDSCSDVRGFKPPHRRSFFFLCQIFLFNYNIHDIFSSLIFHK